MPGPFGFGGGGGIVVVVVVVVVAMVGGGASSARFVSTVSAACRMRVAAEALRSSAALELENVDAQ